MRILVNNVVSPTEALPQSLPIRVISYRRSARAERESLANQRQLAEITEWVTRNGYTLTDSYVDSSASTTSLGGLETAVAQVENGDADAVAVWDVSRIGRQVQDVSAGLDRVEAAGGHVRSVKGGSRLTGAQHSGLAAMAGGVR
jgi:DNA invertase Pin-like site-specific DNA recombinase